MAGIGRTKTRSAPAAAELLLETPRRDERPGALEQEEAQLSLLGGKDSENRRADKVQREIGPRRLGEHAPLSGGERAQDKQRAKDLDELVHQTTSTFTPSSDRVRRELSSERPRGGRQLHPSVLLAAKD
jgi:hypothetical protein